MTKMGGNNATGVANIQKEPLNFGYDGLFASGGWNYMGSYGYYWSSTQYSSTLAYYLDFNSSGNMGVTRDNKNTGIPARCISAP